MSVASEAVTSVAGDGRILGVGLGIWGECCPSGLCTLTTLDDTGIALFGGGMEVGVVLGIFVER
jgi:hypothetical protein